MKNRLKHIAATIAVAMFFCFIVKYMLLKTIISTILNNSLMRNDITGINEKKVKENIDIPIIFNSIGIYFTFSFIVS